jgi:hypothetical protein
MVKSRIGDIYIGMLPPEEKSKHPLSTRKRGKNETKEPLKLVSSMS